MNSQCAKCGRAIEATERIMQLAEGRFVEGAETPTYEGPEPIAKEWHHACIPKRLSAMQEWPYVCPVCGDAISDTDQVVYATVGLKPTTGYLRPETRDRGLYLAVHSSCIGEWIERNPGIDIG